MMTNLKLKQQFNIDGAAEEDYVVDDDMISMNDDYLSESSSESSSINNKLPLAAATQQPSNKKNNFFQMTAQHFMKLFSSKKQSKQTITKITRTTTTTTTLKAAIHRQHENDDLTDDEDNHSIKMNQRKKVVRYHTHHHHHHHQRPKHFQIYHRIPFNQKLNTKNFKLVQIKLDRLNLISNANTNNNTLNTSMFGFTIAGYCPCQIGKVESNSCASNAGLFAGDLIIKINGKNVSRATCDSIVKIIKNLTDQYLIIDVYRLKKTSSVSSFSENPYNRIASSNSSNSNKHKSKKHLSHNELQLNQLNTHHVASKHQHKKDMNANHKTAAFLKEQQYHHRQFITMNNKFIKSIKQQELINKKSNKDDEEYEEEDEEEKEEVEEDEIILAEAEAAAVVVAAAATVTSSTSAMHSLPSPIPYLPPLKTNIKTRKNLLDNDSSDDESSLNDVDCSDSDESNRKYVMNHHEFYYHQNSKKRSSITDSDYKTQSSTTATDNDADTPKQQDEKYLDLDGHMNECEKLFRLEEEFISLMQSGVQQYSRPLRHLMMISQLEHHLLFQNIEKILVLSEYQLNQLISHDESTLIEMFNTIGKLYENKMRMSCEAFDIYLNGIENSFNLLISLIKNNTNNKKFNKFLYESKTEMDLKTFLLLPLYYVSSIHKSLKQIRGKITTTNCDYIPLTNLITSLESHVSKSNLILTKYDNQMNKNPLNVLVLEDNLIYSGSLRYKHKLINLNLYSNRLQLVSDATSQVIYLNQVYKFNFNLANKLEFQFNYLNEKNQEHTIRLRAHNLNEKNEWNKFLTEI